MNKTSINIGKSSFSFDETHGILYDVKGKKVNADIQRISKAEFSVLIDGKSFHLFITRSKESSTASINNIVVEVQLETIRDKLAKQLQKESETRSSAFTQKAPMPGLVTKILRYNGSHVNVGDGILVVEAMKMENEIKSPRSGIVKKVFVQEKQTVEKNDILFTIE